MVPHLNPPSLIVISISSGSITLLLALQRYNCQKVSRARKKATYTIAKSKIVNLVEFGPGGIAAHTEKLRGIVSLLSKISCKKIDLLAIKMRAQ